MQITHKFTDESDLVENVLQWKKVPVRIEAKGEAILDMPEVEVPASWSNSAAQILAHKYFRKAGVPLRTRLRDSASTPITTFLMPRVAYDANTPTGGETSAKQVFHRIAGHWAYEGLKRGYFDDGASARAFYSEIYYMLAMQMAAPNSPQWFNTGIWWAYGIEGNASGCYHSNEIGVSALQVTDTYTYPQTSACFILGLRDSLLGDHGILQTVEREGRIFKFGSGSGINYSSLRAKGASLTNGGTSSGMMSFLKLFDANAGTIKSGGTTRRAARMAVVDADHPEAYDFVTWKAREEAKVSAMVAGANTTTAKDAPSFIQEVSESLKRAEYEGEAYTTVSGQNANNSLRVTNSFMALVEQGERIGYLPNNAHSTRTEKLWKAACEAAWICGDPGIQFHDTFNKWHTIPKVGPQRATNPCSEYAFIDDSSCNLASLNLVKYLDEYGNFDFDKFHWACRLITIALDISVGMSSYPDKKVAENSVDYRAIGLGYANLGGLLMSKGVPYDSEEGRAIAGIITAVMHGTAWNTSSILAAEIGAFKNYNIHAANVADVRMAHRNAALDLLDTKAVKHIRHVERFAWMTSMVSAVEMFWWKAETLAAPIRNAQLTLLAPTGTIGLVMDCDTTGVEPDFSLVKFKKLAGGGTMTLTNALVGKALDALGYTEEKKHEILTYIRTTGKVDIHCEAIEKAHIPVFACANDISVSGHIGMMAAVQPFLSGAISKTVNLPNSATVKDISNAYILAWKSGLKAIALYRDGCKLSQPLTALVSSSPTDSDGPQPKTPDAVRATPQKEPAKRVAGERKFSPRYKMPSRRRGFTQKARINNQSLYLRTGEYADGKIGEVFLNYGRDGSTMSHLMDAIAILMSLGLQHGVPLQEYVDAFTNTRAEPSGMVQNSENVRFCTSIMDYIVRELAAEYLPREEGMPTPAPVEATIGTDEDYEIHDPELEGGKVGLNATADSTANNQSTKPVLTVVGGKEDVTSGAKSVGELTPGLRTLSSGTPRGSASPSAISAVLAAPRYSGDACPSCEAVTLRRSGSCHVCDTCGQTTGCS